MRVNGERGREGVCRIGMWWARSAPCRYLLPVVAAEHHKRVGETLNDGALGLLETLGLRQGSDGAVSDVSGQLQASPRRSSFSGS